ncbi:thioredoxin domain-containing protein [Petroclostridium sp. X23]|uniref:thioredoxin domain-containing protein n=1 Tax=Petroclostridium sp. X23 TaxID=3045146 RepID=UPI0024AE7E72|nr:thioredoxin domain-containing protein [Petroclostridium sp. X23]WHH60752.1 thioredoxin domain-containing protein [Petroclostridium sp. X23]
MTTKIANRLANEKSPYLLQHANNPVDWYPWGHEAFHKAETEMKPIFVSIGYSTCHWCHVMERESFEDEEVADILNKNFISIKVDREERPDIDHIYMTFCQALTGHGGWPLTIIMTPEQKPFFAGTYFPKHNRMGMSGLMEILNRVSETWKKDRDTLMNSGEQIAENISRHFLEDEQSDTISNDILHKAFEWLSDSFEPAYGGFSQAPKFPTPHNLSFLLRYWKITGEQKALDMVEKTLDGMYRGGVFDHIAGGFSRYSTDKKWMVPHFEKMLYDNALLAIAYLETYQVTRNETYAEVAKKIFTYVLRDMVSPEGGFYSAEDADSEGEEGKFYVWTPKEIIEILGEEDGKLFCDYYNITKTGNFEGRNVPNRIHVKGNVNEQEDNILALRQRVFTHREKRIHPYKDDKILTSWNGLMIAAMAIGGRVLGNDSYTEAAEKAVQFIFKNLIREDGRLLARYRDGESAYPAYVDDYAFMVGGLIELYQTTYKPFYLQKAISVNNEMLKYFWDEEKGGLFMYGKDGEQLIVRPKEVYDGAIPSGNSVAALNFLRLARLTGDQELEQLADKQLGAFGRLISQTPIGYTYFLMAVMFALYTTKEVVIAGGKGRSDTQEMIKVIHNSFLPNVVTILNADGEERQALLEMVPFIREQKEVDNKATAYVCQNFSCQAPVTDKNEFAKLMTETNHH